jgi:hypothetical protein
MKENYPNFNYIFITINNPMKPICLFFALFLYFTVSVNAQGTYAGTMKKLIGVKYKESNTIAALKGYKLSQGSLISDVNDPESITVDIYQKGSDAVVFFSIQESQDEQYTIVDVLEYKNVPQGWLLKAAFCRLNETEDVEIVALVKSGTEEFLKPTKQAWRFSRDKRKLLSMDKQGVDCISEGGD